MPKQLNATEWMDEIDNALDYRYHFSKEEKWDDLEATYLNDADSDASVGENLIYSMGDSLISSLMNPDPEFVVTATHPLGVDKAPVVESLDNALVESLKLKQAIDLSLLHCYLNSRAILKIGYDSEYGYNPYFDIGQQGQFMGMTLTQFDKKGRRIETLNSTPGMPWVKACHPKDIVVPWGTVDVEDAPWMAHRIVRKNSYIKADPKYKNATRLEPQMSMQSWVESYNRVLQNNKTRYTNDRMHDVRNEPLYNELWEIRDRMSGRVMVVTRDHDKFLRNEFDAIQALIGGLPFVAGTFVQHPRSFWGTPQAYYLGQIQRTQKDIAVQAEKERRIRVLKYLYKKGLFTEAELNVALSHNVGAAAEVDVSVSGDLRQSLLPISHGPPGTHTFDSQNNKNNAREVIGSSTMDLANFDSPSARRTVGEVQGVQQGAARRSGKRYTMVSNLYVDSIKKVNRLVFGLWKTPRFALIGKDYVPFTGDELKGNYLLDVNLSVKRNLSRAEKKIEAFMLLQNFIGLPGVDIPALYQNLVDAAGDPAFENILVAASRGGQNKQIASAPAAQAPQPKPNNRGASK